MRQKSPQAITYCFDELLPLENSESLKFNIDDTKLPQGWEVCQLSSFQVSDL